MAWLLKSSRLDVTFRASFPQLGCNTFPLYEHSIKAALWLLDQTSLAFCPSNNGHSISLEVQQMEQRLRPFLFVATYSGIQRFADSEYGGFLRDLSSINLSKVLLKPSMPLVITMYSGNQCHNLIIYWIKTCLSCTCYPLGTHDY